MEKDRLEVEIRSKIPPWYVEGWSHCSDRFQDRFMAGYTDDVPSSELNETFIAQPTLVSPSIEYWSHVVEQIRDKINCVPSHW